jgi:PAS domain S-box-containing protein
MQQTTHVGASDTLESGRSREAEETLFNAAPDGLVVIELNGCIVAVNLQMESLFGYTREELLGSQVERLLPEGLRESHVHHRADDTKELNAHSMKVGFNLYGVRKDGSTFPVDINLSSVRVGDETLVIAAVRDVTGRKRAELLLEANRLELERSNLDLASFAYVASPEMLLRDADAAVYRAKELGRGRFEIFDQPMRARLLARSTTESELRHAIDADELVLHYQPLVAAADMRVERVEALVRWEHPERGLLLPRDFIPTAEELGLIVDLGAWVLREACQQTVRWERAAPDQGPCSVAVNVSPRQLDHPDFEHDVLRILEETGAEPKNLWFEITETSLMDPAPTVLEMLGRMREIGIHLAIDDFGTGFSSLSHLRQLRIDELKVDQIFIQGLGRNEDDSAIVAAVVHLAHNMGLTAVAEGVETLDQSRRVQLIGCDLAQGFYYAPPGPASSLQDRYLHQA